VPRGWLLVLCVVLFVWQPLNFSAEVATTLPTLAMRGWPGVLELAVHGLVAAASVAAGWAIWQANPVGPSLALLVLAGSALTGIQSLYWSALPHNTFPADRLLLALLVAGHSCAWMAYLRRVPR
jgi:hypothetical protein